MASQRESSNVPGHRKSGSQDSRGFVYIPGQYTPPATTNKPPNQHTNEPSPPKDSSGSFIQYERIDLDPLHPTESDLRVSSSSRIPGIESDVTRTPYLGHSDRDSLLAPSTRSNIPHVSPNVTMSSKPFIPVKPVKGISGGSSPKRGGASNSGYLTPPHSRGAGDPLVGAKLASHSPEREREAGSNLPGYSFTHHDCHIRSPSNVGVTSPSPSWETPQTTAMAKLPPGAVKLPVPVPRSKPRDSSRPSSTGSSSTATVGPAHTNTNTTSSPSSTPEIPDIDLVTPDSHPDRVIVRQPGTDAPAVGASGKPGELLEPGAASPNPDSQTTPLNKPSNEGWNIKTSKEADKAGGNGSKSKHPLNGIPQTNFMIGLLVTCCFNPPLGIVAMAISLRAAQSYRDGDNKKGACRARASIIISLFSIMITMVVVSTLLVYTAVDKHGYGKKKDPNSKSVLPFGL